MNLNANCFLIKCEKAKTMKKICTLVDNTSNYWIIAVKDNPSEKYFALPHHVRSPKAGEVIAGVRLYD